MVLIYETKNFLLESHEHPEIDRSEWWHMKISPKTPIVDRTYLTPDQAIELIKFTILAGKAMVAWLQTRGISIGRINYQDNGNRTPSFHIHFYGRATTACIQRYGDPLVPGHNPQFKPLDEYDIAAIRQACESLSHTEYFSCDARKGI